MGTGQMMLTLGALVLLSTLTLSVNRALLASNDDMRQSARELQAVSLAQNMIEEALALGFDERTTAPSVFTAPDSTSLGPESGETYGAFDDVDDFNGFERTVTAGGEDYVIRVRVGYVDPTVAAHVTAPAQGPWVQWSTAYAASRTYYKKMEVRVRCPGTSMQICLNHMFAYRP
jgi:hypothetical protein